MLGLSIISGIFLGGHKKNMGKDLGQYFIPYFCYRWQEQIAVGNYSFLLLFSEPLNYIFFSWARDKTSAETSQYEMLWSLQLALPSVWLVYKVSFTEDLERSQSACTKKSKNSFFPQNGYFEFSFNTKKNPLRLRIHFLCILFSKCIFCPTNFLQDWKVYKQVQEQITWFIDPRAMRKVEPKGGKRRRNREFFREIRQE